MQIAFSPAFSLPCPANGGDVTDTSEWAQHALEHAAHAIATIHASINMGPRDSEPLAHDDPALLVGLALRIGLSNRRRGIPADLREKLRHHARAEPACALVLDWLDDCLITDIEQTISPVAYPRN